MATRGANGAQVRGARLSPPEPGDHLGDGSVDLRVLLGGGLHLLASVGVDWS
jgi:hypothetical protein